jgi:hypothetical protein
MEGVTTSIRIRYEPEDNLKLKGLEKYTNVQQNKKAWTSFRTE